MTDGGLQMCYLCRRPIDTTPARYRGEPVHGSCRSDAVRVDDNLRTDGGRSKRRGSQTRAVRERGGVGDQTCRHGSRTCLDPDEAPCFDCLVRGGEA